MSSIVSISNLRLSFGERKLFSEVNLTLRKGELVTLLGENGTGKSSLIKLLIKELKPGNGQIVIDSKSLTNLSVQEISKYISVVLTTKLAGLNMTVKDVVAVGRTPHLNWLGKLTQEDNEKISWALEELGVLHLLDKEVDTLSDGEKQRVMIAKALAQDTPIIILDEPTAHLDVKNRVLLFKLLREIALKMQKIVLISTHELDLGLKLSDKAWLIHNQKVIEESPEDLVLSGLVSKAFSSKNVKFNTAKGSFDVRMEKKGQVNLVGGDEEHKYWFTNALSKIGVRITEEAESEITLNDNGAWVFQGQKGQTINDLISFINHNGIKFE